MYAGSNILQSGIPSYIIIDIIFAAQLWKDNGERLENKNGDWMYMDETWILPNETKTEDIPKGQKIMEGQVIRNTLGRVLIAKRDSKGMPLKLFCTVEIYQF